MHTDSRENGMDGKARKQLGDVKRDPSGVSYASGSEWPVQLAAFISSFDRFGTPPMLLVLAASTGMTFTEAVKLFSIYLLFYALGQPLWGVMSDRFGRLVVLRSALVGGLIGGIGSMLFASFTPLMVARAWTGLMVGALYPTLLTLIGDSAKGTQRARSLSRLQVIGNLGTALATLTAGTLAALMDFRLVFGLTSVGCLVLLLVLRGKRETPRDAKGRVMRHAFRPVVLGVYGLAILEGMVLLGAFTYIVPALEHAGVAVTVAGVLGASYAVGIIGGAQVMHRLVEHLSRTRLMTIGGGILLLGLVASTVSQSPIALTATAMLIGASTAILHVSMQGWATEVAPAARATTVSFFACSLFLGSSLATFVTAHLADLGQFRIIFGLSIPAAVILTITAAWGHSRWMTHQNEPVVATPDTG
jgi:DHA1 family inner membrane transport protein